MYDGLSDLPPLVAKAVALSLEADFHHSCFPEQGRLLQLLAGGRKGGRIGETGTGCGVGLAWMLSAVDADTTIVSVERDATRAGLCRDLFASYPNVILIEGDWTEIAAHGPFDLLVLDGGGGGKRASTAAADPVQLLRPAGTLVLDDFHPPAKRWPPLTAAEADSYGRDLDHARRYWFDHPAMLTTEFRVHPQCSALVGMRRETIER
ncbi:MAG: class I SAM-dependent methyltransferase [Alphaproteobacteria bacterium]